MIVVQVANEEILVVPGICLLVQVLQKLGGIELLERRIVVRA